MELHRAPAELNIFLKLFKFFCIDQSCALTTVISWLVFLALGVLVPGLSYFALSCADCSSSSKPYDAAAQLSLSALAILSFICLSIFFQKHSFLNMLMNETVDIRGDYKKHFKRSVMTLFAFILPCFAAEVAYKIWRFSHGGTWLLGNVTVSNIVVCVVELLSWFYRTMVFFLVCVLFHLTCTLQILRIQHFVNVFYDHPDVKSLMSEHLRIRKHLTVISQGFRLFILGSLVFIIMSQFASLYVIKKPKADIHVHAILELTVCSVTILVGLVVILKSAARIAHKTQALTSFVAKWHTCSTFESMVLCDEDELNKAEFVCRDTIISFQLREALVLCLEKSPAGIDTFGFILDGTSLSIIFVIELLVILWLMWGTIFICLM